jgi:hypothetical protein
MAVHQERGLDELLNQLPPEDAKEVLKDLVFDSIRETLGHSDTVMAKVDDLTNQTGETREDALLKALLLYERALRANRQGQRLVVVGPEYQFIQEIIGLGRDRRDLIAPETAGSDLHDRGLAESGNLAG